jgi:hypothetical protein
LLQYLQWQDGGGRGRRWILKKPHHLGMLETLLHTFPDAVLVHCHRDPVLAIPSFARLLEVTRRMHSDDVDPIAIGEEALTFSAEQMERYLARRSGAVDARIIDVPYGQIRRNVLEVAAQVYDAAGLELSSAALEAMRQWLALNGEPPQGHAYSLERFGLSEVRINRAFAGYVDEFGGMLR